MTNKESILSKDGVSYVLPFILVTFCFALWGFANDITNPMVKAFSKIFRMSVTEGSLVQVAFYGGYFAMAFPAAMFIRRYSYKAGVLMGLGLYAVGAALFFPAKMTGNYYPFLLAYFILTCGLSFLETSCNPYILTMGSEATATRRLNFAQCFNPCGSILGMFVAMNFIQNRLDPRDTEARALLSDTDFEALKQSDLSVLIAPYLMIAAVIAVMFLVIYFARMPKNGDGNEGDGIGITLKRLCGLVRYREGVIAQFFYVGAQIMCWTFIIQYGTRILVDQTPTGLETRILGLLGIDADGVITEKAAEVLSQGYNILAMMFFICSRFICTYFLKYVKPGMLLGVLAVVAGILTAGVIGFENRAGLYCLVGVSGCMSLMFPTIYGIALKGLGLDAKFGAAGLIMAILGGSVLPPVQAAIIDCGTVCGLPSTNASFVLPFICFVVVAAYGFRTKHEA
ncbi:MAG: L-fucose:H+ symporter permease [Bacteroidaceae bacterium]|nr:L-fucose:H+ symporter permease [Bacteroidaceae bacterium]